MTASQNENSNERQATRNESHAGTSLTAENDAPSTNPSHEPSAQADNHKRNHALWWFTFILIAATAAWFSWWFFYLRFYETTDDAYANGSMISINAAIPGSVVSFYADNTDLVNEGQLLVLLDSTKYQMEYDKAIAGLASTVLQVRQLYDSVDARRAAVASKRTMVERTRYDFQNRSGLIGSKAVSNEEFSHSKDDLSVAELNLKQAESELKVALDATGNTPLEKHPNIEQQIATVKQAYYNLQHCSIYAPATGYVAQRAVEVGQTVTPNTAMMAVIPTDYVWVDANFKETQLAHMRIGQPATVKFDIYGSDVKFEGTVIGIASGTGSVFSIIPAQNATGNWIKIVQRLPVRISLDAKMLKDYPIRLGISAEASVDIANRDLPMLAPTPSTKAVASTPVFDIHLEKVNKVINDVIRANLNQEKP